MRFLALFLSQLNRPVLRPLAKALVKLAYKLKGIHAEVSYHKNFKLWEYRVNGNSFFTNTPTWFSSKPYYYNTFKKYAGHFYLPVPGDIVFDVGAGVGEETLVLSESVGRDGKVFSIEANPKTFEVLRYFCDVNNLKNVRILNLALADAEGMIEIEDDDLYGVQNSMDVSKAVKTFKVRATSLDSFMAANNISTIDLLKVNIEGAERQLLEGAVNTFHRIKRVAISCHDFRYQNGESDYFKTFDFVVKTLEDAGFVLMFQKTGDAVIDNYVYGFKPNLLKNQ